MGMTDLLGMFDDENEGVLPPPPSNMLPDHSALTPDQLQGLQAFAASRPRAPKVSVSQVGDMAQPTPFQSLANAAPSDAGGSPPALASGNSPQSPLPQDAELKTAQAKDAREKALSSLGQGYTRMADLILGRANPTAPAGPIGQDAKDLLARRDAARQATADAAQKDLNDPNSPISKRAQLLAAGMGVQGVTGMSAADVQRLQGLIEKGMSADQAAKSLAQEKELAAKKLASEANLKNIEEAGQNRRNAATIAKDLQIAQIGADSRLEKGTPQERQQLQVLQDAKDSVHAFQAALSSHADDDTLRQMHDDLTLKMRELLKRAPNRGPAVAAMMNQIPDPGRLVGGAKAFVGYQDPPKMLDQIDKSLDKELANRGAGGTGGSGPADPQAALRTRIGELKAQGLDKAAIKAQLAKEGLTGGR